MATHWQTRFFTIGIGQAFSPLGSSLVQFALIWWLTQQTGSATVLATASLVAMLPGVLLGPVAGALVDRWPRRWIMVGADSLVALFTLVLAWIAWVGVLAPWHIYGVMFLRALAGAFHWPAMQASTSLMVPREHLPRIAGMNQTLQGLMSIVAPPLGALLLGVMPLAGVLSLDVGTALLAVVPLLFIPVPQPRDVGGQRITLFHDIYQGFRYIWAWRGLFLILMLATLINFLLNPGFSLLPLLVQGHFGGTALHLGWMDSAWGVGIIIGGVVLGAWGGFKRRIYTSLMGLLGIGAGTLFLGLAPARALGWALAAMGFLGFVNPITNGPLLALLQDLVAPEMQGRVFTTVQSLAGLMTPLGLALAGPLADALGVQSWFIIGGVGCFALGLSGFLIPAIVHIEEQRPAATG